MRVQMTKQDIAKVTIECDLGPSNRFRLVATLAGSSAQVLATGAAGQHVELFRALLRKLAVVYPMDNAMTVEVQKNRIIGVP
jgi:hypothetical protein